METQKVEVKKKSRFAKHPFITGFLILCILAGIFWSQNSTTNNNTNWTNNSNQAISKSSQTVYKAWDSIQVWKLTYMISDLETLQSVWSQYSPAKANWIFKVMTVTVRNNWDKPMTMDSSMFKLYDSQGRQFSPSIEWNTALTFDWQKDFFLTQLQPWLDTSWKVIFDVPKDAQWLQLEISGWFWSNDKARVNI